MESKNSVGICKIEPPDDDVDIVFENSREEEKSCPVQLTDHAVIEYDESVIKSEIEIETEKCEAVQEF